eukprot:scaffold893_cov336-Prasinococcus_capsulatus_cf.AAC.2
MRSCSSRRSAARRSSNPFATWASARSPSGTGCLPDTFRHASKAFSAHVSTTFRPSMAALASFGVVAVPVSATGGVLPERIAGCSPPSGLGKCTLEEVLSCAPFSSSSSEVSEKSRLREGGLKPWRLAAELVSKACEAGPAFSGCIWLSWSNPALRSAEGVSGVAKVVAR